MAQRTLFSISNCSSSDNSTIIHFPQVMTDLHDDQSKPVIEKINGMWRVTYAGIVKEHRQDWQAEWHYQQAMGLWLAARCRNC
jgi:hypothetical protein